MGTFMSQSPSGFPLVFLIGLRQFVQRLLKALLLPFYDSPAFIEP